MIENEDKVVTIKTKIQEATKQINNIKQDVKEAK